MHHMGGLLGGSMPSEQEDARARQLEALRRHMAHPDIHWEPPAELGLVRGQVATEAARPPGRRRPPRDDTSGLGPVATPACKTAVDRANAMLASAVKLRRALAERRAAARRAASDESARFDRALEAYRQVVDRCDLRVT